MIPCMACHGNDPTCAFCAGRGHHVLNKSRRHRKQETETMTTPASTDTELLAWAAAQTWSSFAVDVAAKGARWGLSDKQRAALVRMKAKCGSESPAEKKAPTAGVSGFSTAIFMLDHIDASGNKWPKVFLSLKADAYDDAEDRRIKLYRYQSGENTGAAGMKLGDDWLGNIDREGVWTASAKAAGMDREDKVKLWNVLKLLRDDPATLFARNGKLLGTCACCGRPLSNDESVQIGIGPECRGKLGGVV